MFGGVALVEILPYLSDIVSNSTHSSSLRGERYVYPDVDRPRVNGTDNTAVCLNIILDRNNK